MKVAVAALRPNLNSKLAPLFGRAQYFVVANTESGELLVHNNAVHMKKDHAAGIHAAGAVVHLGVDAVITTNIGPKAIATLRYGYVKVYRVTRGTVGEAIEKAKEGQLEPADAANVEGHWRQPSK